MKACELNIYEKRQTAYMYMKLELEVPKNTEWQEQISHNSMPDTFQSLPWSLQGRIVKESSNITNYSSESGDLCLHVCCILNSDNS